MRFIFFIVISSALFLNCENTTQEINTSISDVQGKGAGESKPLPQTITFPSLDKLTITGRLYHHSDKASTLLLCHQARFNKAEYEEIALVLHQKGFNCLAIDQRSGYTMSEGKTNETYNRAIKASKATTYLDAEQDIVAAINWLVEKYQKPIILWGSSYSASLSLKIGANNDNVEAIIAFSPGEYFGKEYNLKNDIQQLNKPTFVTSSKKEAATLGSLIEGLPTIIQFIPVSNGIHGSKALWPAQPFQAEYWKAVDSFLDEIQ